MKLSELTIQEVILFVLIIVMLIIGYDHLVLRSKVGDLKWRYEATAIINNHEKLLTEVARILKLSTTPQIPEMQQEQKK